MAMRRVAPMPTGWGRLRRSILIRDNYRCPCGEFATDVDHVIPAHHGGTDDPSNLRSLCGPCHGSKTGREAALARGPRLTRRRAEEQHPGLTPRPVDTPPIPPY